MVLIGTTRVGNLFKFHMKVDPVATDLLIRITLLREADDEACHTEAWRLWGMYEQIFGMPPAWQVWDEAYRLMKRKAAFRH